MQGSSDHAGVVTKEKTRDACASGHHQYVQMGTQVVVFCLVHRFVLVGTHTGILIVGHGSSVIRGLTAFRSIHAGETKHRDLAVFFRLAVMGS